MSEEMKEAPAEEQWEQLEIFGGDYFDEIYDRYMQGNELLQEAMSFMNMVPNHKYGDNYAICSKISNFLKNK